MKTLQSDDVFILSLAFFLIPFVKGDSYPELCAQRTDEGEGFPLVTRRVQDRRAPGGAWSACVFLFPCPSLSYVRIPWE
jgi:hypothetical protein